MWRAAFARRWPIKGVRFVCGASRAAVVHVPSLPLFRRAVTHLDKVAMVAGADGARAGTEMSYRELLHGGAALAARLRLTLAGGDVGTAAGAQNIVSGMPVGWDEGHDALQQEHIGARLNVGALRGQHVAFMAPYDCNWALSTWGIWHAGGVAVPLHTKHPVPELQYIISDAKPALVLAHSSYTQVLAPLASEAGIPWAAFDLADDATAEARACAP